MCGIVGYVGNYRAQHIEAMLHALKHRGPDGDGMWIDSGIGLGHARLAIIDPTASAAQPMQGCDGRYVVTFNGEIYNYRELADELLEAGYQFNTKSDTAILAPLYDRYGAEMLDKLSGIFAFAIWDRKEQKLFAARDHAGVKPFYYTRTNYGIAFASELKSLLYLPGVSRELDENALFSYLTYLWCPGERTMLSQVKKLLPGHVLTITADGEMAVTQWYHRPCLAEAHTDSHATKEDVIGLLDDVVSEQLVADVPVGSFLSGGVDSSAIVTSIAGRDQRPLETYCLHFENDAMREEGFSLDGDYAHKVASLHDQVNLNYVYSTADCLRSLPSMVYYLDEPQADPAPLYVQQICRQAKQNGIKVLMSGTGGDDVFSGYRRHVALMAYHKLSFLPRGLRLGMLEAASFLPLKGAFKRRLEKLKYVFQGTLEQSILAGFHYTAESVLVGLLSPELQQKYQRRTLDHLEETLSRTEAAHPLNRQLHLELHGFLPDHNLNYTDKLSMAEGVEVRVPFVDKRFMGLTARMDVNHKVTGKESKWLLKKALEARLPSDILYRSKAGFGAPVRQWIVTDARGWVEQLLLTEPFTTRGLFNPTAVKNLLSDTISGRVDGAYTLLALIVIELWLRQFVDTPVPTKMADIAA